MVSLREVQHTNREPDRPRDHQETAGGGNRTDGASQSCPDADRDTDDIRSRHELAETDDVGEFGLAYPPALIDGDAVRPDEAAAEPAQRDLEECDKKRAERYGLCECSRRCRLEHCRPPNGWRASSQHRAEGRQ